MTNNQPMPAPLPDLTAPDGTPLPLEHLLFTADTALAKSVRRVVDEVRTANGNYAAHGSSPADRADEAPPAAASAATAATDPREHAPQHPAAQ